MDPTLAGLRGEPVRETVALADPTLRAPVPAPRKVIGIGINCASHIEEVKERLASQGVEIPDDPVFFLAPGTAVVGPRSSWRATALGRATRR